MCKSTVTDNTDQKIYGGILWTDNSTIYESETESTRFSSTIYYGQPTCLEMSRNCEKIWDLTGEGPQRVTFETNKVCYSCMGGHIKDADGTGKAITMQNDYTCVHENETDCEDSTAANYDLVN